MSDKLAAAACVAVGGGLDVVTYSLLWPSVHITLYLQLLFHIHVIYATLLLPIETRKRRLFFVGAIDNGMNRMIISSVLGISLLCLSNNLGISLFLQPKMEHLRFPHGDTQLFRVGKEKGITYLLLSKETHRQNYFYI